MFFCNLRTTIILKINNVFIDRVVDNSDSIYVRERTHIYITTFESHQFTKSFHAFHTNLYYLFCDYDLIQKCQVNILYKNCTRTKIVSET